jgi:hypothetical protein
MTAATTMTTEELRAAVHHQNLLQEGPQLFALALDLLQAPFEMRDAARKRSCAPLCGGELGATRIVRCDVGFGEQSVIHVRSTYLIRVQALEVARNLRQPLL